MADPNFVNPYEQIWKTRDLRALQTPVELENKLPEWRRGLGAYGKELQATGYGLAALGSQGLENVIGENAVTKGITDWGIEGYNRSIAESQTGLNAPSVARIEDIKNASDAMDWAGYQLGKGLPMLGTLALTGGVGGAVARLGAKEGVKQLVKAKVGDVVKKGVEAGALKAVEGQVVTKAMQQAAAQSLRNTVAKGIATGGFAGSFGMEGGQAFGEQVQEGATPADAVKSAIAVGGINGALEFLPFYAVAKRVGMGDYAKKRIADIISNDADLSKKAIALATAKEIGGRAAKGGAVGAVTEGLTEGLQELTNIAGVRWAKEDPLFADLGDDDWSQVKNAMAAGALVGGTAAGAGATVVGPEKPTDESVPTSAPAQSKLEALKANRDKLAGQIDEAVKAGDTKKAGELQAVKDIYDIAIDKTVPAQEAIPAQESARETIPTQEPDKEAAVSEVTPVVEAGVPTLETVKPTEEAINAQEVQAQTEAPIKQEPLYSRPLQKPDTDLFAEDETPQATEATMEEFEAVRKQFQEKQANTPFKKWFGKGTTGVTATAEGEPIPLYHGTNNPDFYEWDSTRAAEASGHPTSGLGFFMTADKGSAARYGSNLIELHAKIDNPYELTDADLTSIESPADAKALREKLIERGYDGAIVTAPGAKPYVIAFQKNQIKLTSNKNPTAGPDMRFSKPLQKPLPTFYSALERTVQETKQEKAAPAQWESSLDNMVKKGLVKQEELDWSGTKEWLQEQKEPVTKEALLKHVRDNTLEVKELELGAGGLSARLNDSRNWEIVDSQGNIVDTFEDYNAENPTQALEYSGIEQPRNTRWTLPGGENQRELVLTAPSIEPFDTDTTHYGDVGGGRAVAWVRFNDRVDENGKKVLFVEEIQSKRHQEGKEKGYADFNLAKEEKLLADYKQIEKDAYAKLISAEKQKLSEDIIDALRVKLEHASSNLIGQDAKIANLKDKIPNAPFKQTIAGSGQTLSGWAGLVFKRMLRYAVENGYDKIALTNGKQQAKRYNLAKEVESIYYFGPEHGVGKGTLVALRPGQSLEGEYTRPVLEIDDVSEDEIASYIGNENTKKLLSSKEENINGALAKKLNKADLLIGGEKLKKLYDEILPTEINKYVKKWGAKVEQTEIKFGDESASVPTVEITPAMRDSVMRGQPLFSKENAGAANTSVQDFHSNINSIMGEGWLQQAIDLGLVEVIEGPGPSGESGSWAGDRIRLYTGSIPENSSPAGVLLHEGKHATFADVLGDSLQEYVKDLHTLANNGNKIAQDAITHAAIAATEALGVKHRLLEYGNKADLENLRAIIEARRPGLLAEEELAYFVQYGTEAQGGAGFLRRLINAIKAWFAQTRLGQRMKELGLGFELTDAMAVEWAKMGLNRSLAETKQAAQVKAKVEEQAAAMPASARLGKALEALKNVDPLYSMGIKDLREQLWNDPTDPRLEIVNKPGLLQKLRADFVDFFAEMEKKSKHIYDTYMLQRAKKGARIEKSRQAYLLPLRELIANSPWTAKEVGDMLAARHIKVDNVNIDLAERASYSYTKELLKALPKTKQKELMKARVNVKAGKMPDGSVYKDANGNVVDMSSRTKRKLMFDLMNKYAPLEVINTSGIQELKEEWEIFKDAAGGFSSGGAGKNIVRTIDDVLAPASKDQAKFDEIANLFDSMNRYTLDILEEGGLITAKEHARLLTSKSAYAPLRRESYNIDRDIELLFKQAGTGGSKQITTRAGTANLSEPTLVLQNALAKVEAASAAAERNLANKELYKTVVADREGWKPWFAILDKDPYVTHDEDGFLQEKRTTAINRADIVLINDGKKIVIRPNMHNERAMGFVRAVNNLDMQMLSGPMKIMGWVNSLLRWVNVSASPVFLMSNLIRDPFTAAYNLQATEAAPYTKDIFLNWKRSFKALKKVYIDNNRDLTDPDVRMLERFEKAGGRTSFVLSLKEMDDNNWDSFEGQVARRQGNMKYLMAVKDKWLDGIENYNILFENIMRFSSFMTLMEKGGISEARAARISQDMTTNFTRRGYKSQMLGVWWLFFNASVQGNYQVLRNLMSSKRVQAAAGGTILAALMLDLLGRALADDWDEIPEWDKERFIILPIKVAGDFVKIPAPWVYNIVWRMGGMLGETLAGVRKPQDIALDIPAMAMGALSPLGKPGSLAQAITPTAADPFIQILENKDFSGNPIGPEGYPGASKKANSELLWSTTPKGYQSFARFVNEATGGSAAESGKVDLRPGDYQILARFLTGSLGRFLSESTYGFKGKIEEGIEGPKDIPIVREFFTDPYDPMLTQKYHTNIASIYGAHRLEQMYVKGPDRDLIKLQEVRTERANELRMYSQAQDVEKQLKSLRTKMRAAQNREDSGREKELKERMSRVQEQFNLAYEQKVK